MIRTLVLVACLSPGAALAQSTMQPPADMGAMHQMIHGQHMMSPGQHMMQGQHTSPMKPGAGQVATEPGQGAFAAIQEVVELLEADPTTDWSKVNIDALRQHLIDMDNVTLHAEVRSEDVDGGVRFIATGSGAVVGSIQRMTLAHVKVMNGIEGWTLAAAPVDGGAALTVKAPAKDLPKVKALGYIGVLTLGMHHQMHHLMIARGQNPHG